MGGTILRIAASLVLVALGSSPVPSCGTSKVRIAVWPQRLLRYLSSPQCSLHRFGYWRDIVAHPGLMAPGECGVLINISPEEAVGRAPRDSSQEQVHRFFSTIRGLATFPTIFRLSQDPTNCICSSRPRAARLFPRLMWRSITSMCRYKGFDINEDALGQDIADERVFRDVSPGKDGFLRINFSGALSPPSLNGIEGVSTVGVPRSTSGSPDHANHPSHRPQGPNLVSG